jgi:membrane protein implicated in regulation of membrane protease activity
MVHAAFRLRTNTTHPTGFLPLIVKLVAAAAAGIALLAMVLVGLFVLLPLLLAGGTALYFYLRRRVRQARPRSPSDVIDAEYTVIERR